MDVKNLFVRWNKRSNFWTPISSPLAPNCAKFVEKLWCPQRHEHTLHQHISGTSRCSVLNQDKCTPNESIFQSTKAQADHDEAAIYQSHRIYNTVCY